MMYCAAFRAKARSALKNHWQTALLIALIVNLPTLLVQGIAAFTQNDLALRMENLLLEATYSTAALETLPEDLRALIAEGGVLAMSGLSLLAWVISIPLSLGMTHWTLERVRGGELPVATVTSRMRIFGKSIGLRLFIVLKVLIWMLPGVAVSLLSILPVLSITPSSGSYNSMIAAYAAIFLVYLGMSGMIVLGVMGYLRYAVAEFILADEPEERALNCARRSKGMMKGRKGKMLGLWMSILPWYLLVIFGSFFIEGIAGSVVSLMLQMLGSLFVSVYLLTSESAFYEALRLAPEQRIAEKEI